MKLSLYMRSVQGGVAFYCAGCKDMHVLWTEHDPAFPTRPCWSWNGDAEKPVLSPSVLATSGHYVHGWSGKSCWCTYNKEHVERGEEPSPFSCQRCHSFIGCNGAEPGYITYLQDSTHHLAGQTVPLSPIPSNLCE